MSTEDITNQTYDRIAASFAEQYWDVVLSRALDAFSGAIGGARHVLDLGCGPGRDLALLRGRGLATAGLDLSAGMLRVALSRVGGPLVRANMRALPFAAAAFDGVWMCASLIHIERAAAPAVLAGVRRVLAPGGVLYLSVIKGDGEAWSEGDGGPRFFTFYQPMSMANLLAAAGLTLSEAWTAPTPSHTWLNFVATTTPAP